jgi:hypothetical protein
MDCFIAILCLESTHRLYISTQMEENTNEKKGSVKDIEIRVNGKW